MSTGTAVKDSPQTAEVEKRRLEKQKAEEKEAKRVKDILSEYPRLEISMLSEKGAQPVVVRVVAKVRSDLTVSDVRSVARRLAAPLTGEVVQVEMSQMPGPFVKENGEYVFSTDPKKIQGYVAEAIVSSVAR